MRKALLCLALAATCAAGPARAGDVPLLSHRASYELSLAERKGSVTSAHGLMVMTMEDACDAWRVRQGLALSIARDEQAIATTSDFDSSEGKDGSWYSFEDRTNNDPGGEELSVGKAMAGEGTTGLVEIREPESDEGMLPPGTVFPMGHLVAILEGAAAGETLMSHVLFDGTDGTLVYDVSTVVGPAAVSADNGMRVWPVRLAFYPHDSAEEAPELEIDARLREDGVAEALSYDYGSFVLSGTLRSLEPLPPPDC
jgi:hypothetical protein